MSPNLFLRAFACKVGALKIEDAFVEASAYKDTLATRQSRKCSPHFSSLYGTLSAQGTFDLEAASECFAAISGFAAGFLSRFQAPPSIPDSRAYPTSSSSILYFQNHTPFPESRPHL
jgi:hypothetical protein